MKNYILKAADKLSRNSPLLRLRGEFRAGLAQPKRLFQHRDDTDLPRDQQETQGDDLERTSRPAA